MSEALDFNKNVAEDAHNIYVLFQSGDSSITPAVMKFDPETAGYFKTHMALSEEALDPSKLSQAGLSDVNEQGVYFSEPAFTEAVRVDYNRSMQVATDAFNDLAEKLGIEDRFEDPKSLDDLVADHNEIQNWQIIDRALESVIKSSENYSSLDEEVQVAISAREALVFHGALAQETYDVYSVTSDPAGPEKSYEPMNFDALKFDDPLDAVKLQNPALN